jgi:hypothetical protein
MGTIDNGSIETTLRRVDGTTSIEFYASQQVPSLTKEERRSVKKSCGACWNSSTSHFPWVIARGYPSGTRILHFQSFPRHLLTDFFHYCHAVVCLLFSIRRPRSLDVLPAHSLLYLTLCWKGKLSCCFFTSCLIHNFGIRYTFS